jgi:ferritin-like protein
MSDYHEPFDVLPDEARNIHRALVSLKEEIEAVDWYSQRIAVTSDPALRAVLAHSRDEEVEHACMTLEWLRQSVPVWDEQLRKRLFVEGTPAEGNTSQVRAAGGVGLGIGKRRPGE